MFDKFKCPKCGNPLFESSNSLRCKNNHTYDIAKSGYVNLLLANMMNSKSPGDNKQMVLARKNFLSKGYYQPLADAFAGIVSENFTSGMILDAGCGEGYYTQTVAERLKSDNATAKIYGIDISKFAVESASKRTKLALFATAGIFHIPLNDGECDLLMTLFAPYCGEEFQRVLKPKGIMVMAIPSENHLWGLKKAVYDDPYKNSVQDYDLDGFEFLGSKKLEYTINLPSNEDIQALFMMTPYYYKTSVEGQERLAKLSQLETEIAFEILTYRKK